jgi:hypothetical protein
MLVIWLPFSGSPARCFTRLTSRRLRCLRKDISENIIIPQFPMSEPTAPLKTEGCLPRESFQGKSDSLYLAHFLEDAYI